MELLAQEILPQLGYDMDAIADPVTEFKNAVLTLSGLRVDSENFEASILTGLGYRTDSISPSSFNEAIRLLVKPYRIDAEADPRDLIMAAALDDLGKHITELTKEISTKVKAWQKEGLTLEQISDRVDSIYSSDDYKGEAFTDEFANWLTVAYLGGAEIGDR